MVGWVADSFFVAAVMLGMLYALIRGWKTPEVVVFLCLLLVWNAGIVSDEEALSGFHSPSVLVVGTLFVMVKAVERSRVVEKAARRILGMETSFAAGLTRLMLLSLLMSAIFNSTAVVALLIPVTHDWAYTRGFPAACLLMPVSFASAFGGLLTTVGGDTSVVIQGLLRESAKDVSTLEPIRWVDRAFVGLPLVLMGIFYLVTVVSWVLPQQSKTEDVLGHRSFGGEEHNTDCSSRECPDKFVTEVELTTNCGMAGKSAGVILGTYGLPMESLVGVMRRKGSHAPRVHELQDQLARNCSGGSTGDLCLETGGIKLNAEDIDVPSPLASESFIYRTAVAITEGITATSRRVLQLVLPQRRHAYVWLNTDRKEALPSTGSDADVSPGLFSGIEMAAKSLPVVRDKPGGEVSTELVTGNGKLSTSKKGKLGSAVTSDGDFEIFRRIPAGMKMELADVLVLNCSRKKILEFLECALGEHKGDFKILGIDRLALPRKGAAVFELVLSSRSQFVGRSAMHDNPLFAARHGFSIIAFRLKKRTAEKEDKDDAAVPFGGNSERRSSTPSHAALSVGLDPHEHQNPPDRNTRPAGEIDSSGKDVAYATIDEDPLLLSSTLHLDTPTSQNSMRGSAANPGVSKSPVALSAFTAPELEEQERMGAASGLGAGDTMIVLAEEDLLRRFPAVSSEFLSKKKLGRVPQPAGLSSYLPVGIFGTMLVWASTCNVSMVRVSFAGCAVLILGGWVKAELAVGCVDWELLLLIGSSLGLSKAIPNSGLASLAGDAMKASGMSHWASLCFLFGFSTICTELVTGYAAAALILPMALRVAQELEVSYKPYAMAVFVATSCSFLTPIGNSMNAMVWKPGGYKFHQYAKLGAPLTLMFWVLACTLIPLVFPF